MMKLPVVQRKKSFMGLMAQCRSGVAALEFAIILPVMITLFFGVVEASDALAQSRRISIAVNTLADLVAQEAEILESDVDALFDGVTEIAGVRGDGLSIKLASVMGDGEVHWTRNSGGGGSIDLSPIDSLVDPSSSLVIAQIEYSYTSALSQYIFKDMIKFDETASRWPRRSSRVLICRTKDDCE